MKSTSFLAIFFTGFIMSSLTMAIEDPPFTITLNPLKTSYDPGFTHNITCRIKNNQTGAISVDIKPELPEGWKLTIPLQTVTIKPGAQQLVIISFNIPALSRAGKQTLVLRFSTKDTKGPFQIVTDLGLTIPEIERLNLDLFEAPAFVRSGETISASFLLKNNGNSQRRVQLTSNDGMIGTGFGSSVVLKPGESVIIPVLAKTSRELAAPQTQGISLTATLSESTVKRVYHSVRVFPEKEQGQDLFFRYPVNLSARYLARGREGERVGGYQLEASGNGFLDLNKAHKLDFMARGPNNFDLSFLGLYDQYFIGYENNFIGVQAGHQSFSFTPLTEAARFGSGINSSIKFKKHSTIGFAYVIPRFYKDIEKEMALSTRLNLWKENYAGFYYIARKDANAAENAELISLIATLKPMTRTSLEMEYSKGWFRGVTDDAWRVNLNTQLWIFALSGNYFFTGKEYPGFYTNSTFYTGNLYFNLSKRLNLGISARQDYMNAALDTLFATAPFSKNHQASLNYRPSRHLSLRTYYARYEREDRMPMKQFHYNAETVNLNIGLSAGKFGVQAGGEAGITKNLLLGVNNNTLTTWRGLLNLSYQPNYRFAVQGFGNFTNQNSFIAEGQNNFIWGISAQGNLARDLRINLQVQNSYSIEDYYRNRNLFQLNLDYSFLKRHKLSVSSFYTLFQNRTTQPDFSAAISYSVVIGIPIKKTGEAGTLAGVVTDDQGRAVQKAVFYLNGRSAITNEKGEFIFRNLNPGTFQLIPDNQWLGLDYTTDLTLPAKIKIEANETTSISIAKVKASHVTGKITAAEPPKIPGVAAGEPATTGNIILELTDNIETYRVVTFADGSFSFPKLRPGKWTLKIYKNNIDSRYVLRDDNFELNLLPGEYNKLNIELAYRERKVVFSAGTLTATGAGQTTRPAQPTNLAPKKTAVKENAARADSLPQVWFAVQVAASIGPLQPGALKPLKDFSEIKLGKWYKYFSGHFSELAAARKETQRLRQWFPGAFVTGFHNGNPVSVQEALKLLNSKKP